MEVTPHLAQNTTNRRSAIDGRTSCHPNYRLNQKVRKVEEDGQERNEGNDDSE
jgi:hypothetical protein